MSKPPMKAVEQIKNYCEKTQCRRCAFCELIQIDEYTDYGMCMLQMSNPCEWELEQKPYREETK